MSKTVNAKDYGILPNTGADVYHKIVKLQEELEIGDSILLEKGTYIISDYVECNKVNIIGDTTTIIKGTKMTTQEKLNKIDAILHKLGYKQPDTITKLGNLIADYKTNKEGNDFKRTLIKNTAFYLENGWMKE